MGERNESIFFSAVDLAAEQVFRKINSDGSLSISCIIPSQSLPDLALSPSAQIQPLPQPVRIPCSVVIHGLGSDQMCSFFQLCTPRTWVAM